MVLCKTDLEKFGPNSKFFPVPNHKEQQRQRRIDSGFVKENLWKNAGNCLKEFRKKNTPEKTSFLSFSKKVEREKRKLNLGKMKKY